MTDLIALHAPQIFDGTQTHQGAYLLIRDGRVVEVAAQPYEAKVTELPEGMLTAGLVDLQVNGGGGVMLNDARTPEAMAQIAAAHRALGTTALLPTLITAAPHITTEAISAAQTPQTGVLGLHLEGPHLDPRRKGAHSADLIRPMDDTDLAELCAAARALPTLMVTVAPESVRPDQIAALRSAGAIVSLGHSDTDYATALSSGAQCVTHLFNAMSPLGHRAPGLVGAALDSPDLWAGLIADAVHVAPETIRLALRAKSGPGRIFLVSDAMATVGSDIRSFTLDGREILRGEGRLVLADDTLAGADIDLLSCVQVMHTQVGLPLEEALRMASLYPAQMIGRADEVGCLSPGARADLLWLRGGALAGLWVGGQPV